MRTVTSPVTEQQRCRCAFSYAICGDLRFLSHQDTLRLFRRALARAELPVRFTEGFNPHPRLSISLPRPVGIASEAETIVVEFDEPIEPDDAVQRLDHETPGDLRVTSARLLSSGETLQPCEVRYELDVGSAPPADLEARVRRIAEAAVLEVERLDFKSKRSRTLDVRPYLIQITLEGGKAEFTLRVTGSGTAKPSEIAALLGFDAQSINHRIRRIDVRFGSINTG